MNELTECFNEVSYRIIEDETGEKWIAALDVAKALGYKNPSTTVDNLKRYPDLYDNECTRCMGVDSATRGKQNTIMFNLDGVITFCLKSSQPQAIPFQKWARKVLRKELEKKQTNLDYKSIRLTSKQKRKTFTDSLKDHGVNKQHEFIQLTYSIKKNLDIDTKKKKDMMDIWELTKVMISEAIATTSIELKNPNGYQEIKTIVNDSAKFINDNFNTKQIEA